MTNTNVVPFRAAQSNDTPPDFIHRIDISKASDDELEELITRIRSNRMRAFIMYQDTMEKKKEVEDAKAAARVEKQCEMIAKQVGVIDKQLDKLETMINKLRGLRIQANMPMI